MPGSSETIDDDDNAARLMPNVAKLIRADSDSLESRGSTSMSMCGISGKDKIEAQNSKPSRQRRAEAVLQDVANKFLRRGAADKRSVGACAPPTLDMFSSCHWSSANRGNVCSSEKENVRPKSPTLVKQGALPIHQQNVTSRDASQIAAKEYRRNSSRSLVKLGQRKAANLKTTPISLSELQEKFAELDGEALEEEEVSLAHLTIVKPVLATKTVLQNDGNVAENRDLSRGGRGDYVSAALNPTFEEAKVPNFLCEQGQEGTGMCTNESKLSKSPDREQHVQVSEPTSKGNARGHSGVGSETDCDAVSHPETQPRQHPDVDDHRNLERRTKIRHDKSPPRLMDSSNPSVNGMENKARTANMKSSPIPLDASGQEFSGNGRHVSLVFELEHAAGSCNFKRGHLSLKLVEENVKEMTAIGIDPDASHREDAGLGHSSTLGGDGRRAPLRAESLLERKAAPDVPNLEENCHTGHTSATPARNPLFLTCLHYSRIGRSIDMSKRRLVFDSSSESLSLQKVVCRHSADDSVPTVEFSGGINPATDVLNPDVHEYEASVTAVPHQEAKLPFTDDNAIGHVDEMACRSQSSKPKAAAHYEEVVEREPPLTGSFAQEDNMPDIEASRGVVEIDAKIDSLDPLAGPATEVATAQMGKRTRANLGDPIDGGTEWRQGRRVSTRIKSRPLDWWRGERMLYGRVHSTLCTLIGIKTTTPDPIWPRPKPQRGDYTVTNFHIDSFVGDSHRDLLRLAAQ